MNCIEHDDRNAVGTCAQCGVGICKECEANTIFRVNNQALCRKCNYGVACENDRIFQSGYKIKKITVIVNAVAFLAGLLAYFISNSIVYLLLFWFVGGLVASITGRANMKKSQQETTFLRRIAAFIGKLIGTALACPVVMLMGLWGMHKVKKQIAENDAILRQFGVENNQQGDTNG